MSTLRVRRVVMGLSLWEEEEKMRKQEHLKKMKKNRLMMKKMKKWEAQELRKLDKKYLWLLKDNLNKT